MRFLNIWSWPMAVYDDIRQWLVVRKALKEAEVIQQFKVFKYELRVDKIGRVYTVINVPEELWEYDKQDMVWPWMLEQLRELDDLLISIRLSDLLYPEVSLIDNPESMAYLVVLTPSSESFSISSFISWLLNISIYIGFFYILNKNLLKIWNLSIFDLILSLF